MHSYYSDPDLSQVPEVGVEILQCIVHPSEVHANEVIIAVQPTPAPCMVRIGSELQYEPMPNAGRYDNVIFDVVSENLQQ